MKTQPVSIEPILREIDALVERIRTAQLSPSQEFERTKALKMLDAVGQMLRAFCLAPSGEPGYLQFEVATGAK